MKKIIYSLLAFVLILPFAFCLVGCIKNDEVLEKDDVVGNWYAISVRYTEEGEEPTTYSYERFNQLRNKENRTSDENTEYQRLFNVLFKYKVMDDGKLKFTNYAENAEYVDCGTWEIKNNKLIVDIDKSVFGIGEGTTVTTKYENSRIIITVIGDNYTTVTTLAKVA